MPCGCHGRDRGRGPLLQFHITIDIATICQVSISSAIR
jgi:hypothetical protein